MWISIQNKIAAALKRLVAWAKQTKWAMWAALAFGVAVVTWCVRTIFSAHPEGAPTTYLPPAPEKLQMKVQQVQEEAMVAVAKAKVQADTDKKELEEIAKIPDGKERRQRLADKLKQL